MKMLRAFLAALIALASIQAEASPFTGRRAGGNPTPTLIAGGTAFGSWSATTAASNQGDSGDYGYSLNSMGAWDTPPFLTFTTGDFYIGIDAWHIPTPAAWTAGQKRGMAKVRYSVDNGPWVDVTSLSVNPDTGVTGFVIKGRPQDFADGPHELRGELYPTTGVPLVLQGTVSSSTSIYSLVFNTNYNGGLDATSTLRHVDDAGTDDASCGQSAGDPCLTFTKAIAEIVTAQGSDVGGSTICALPGTYTDIGASSVARAAATRWVTIEPCAGYSQADVILSTSGSSRQIGAEKLRLKNVQINYQIRATADAGRALLQDGILYTGAGKADATDGGPKWASGWSGGAWAIDSEATAGRGGFLNYNMVRNGNVHDISGDSYSNSYAVFNSVADFIDGGSYGFHPDVYSVDGVKTNIVVDGLTATGTIDSAGFFVDDTSDSCTDCAFVNFNFDSSGQPGARAPWQVTGPLVNTLFANDSWLGGDTLYQGNWSFTDVAVNDNECTDAIGPVTGVTYRGSATCD